MRLPSTRPEDPSVGQFVDDELRLAVGDDPGREAFLAGQPLLEVLVGVDALGGQRPEHAGGLVEQLDGDVVGMDHRVEALGDLVEDSPRVERRRGSIR